MCSLDTDQIGLCGVRINDGHEIRDTKNQQIVASHLDPIEKKPMYHFFPNTKTYSIGMLGCNIKCQFCQNYHITQSPYIQSFNSSEGVDIPYLISEMKVNNSKIMSYTYSEPLVWQDVMIPIAKRVREEGLYNLLVTNGTFSEDALLSISPLIDAMNIDVKGDEAFYTTFSKAPHAFEAVKRSIDFFIQNTDAIIEVTTLIIEDVHTKKMIKNIGMQLKDLGVEVWHLSRFFPTYHMTKFIPTSTYFLEEMMNTAHESGIRHIYKGNVSNNEGRTITCSACGELISRAMASELLDKDGQLYCPSCHTQVYGKFNYSI
jgi:pyruvate formate lyase activating enzyme